MARDQAGDGILRIRRVEIHLRVAGGQGLEYRKSPPPPARIELDIQQCG
jgi:hypothetical protein